MSIKKVLLLAILCVGSAVYCAEALVDSNNDQPTLRRTQSAISLASLVAVRSLRSLNPSISEPPPYSPPPRYSEDTARTVVQQEPDILPTYEQVMYHHMRSNPWDYALPAFFCASSSCAIAAGICFYVFLGGGQEPLISFTTGALEGIGVIGMGGSIGCMISQCRRDCSRLRARRALINNEYYAHMV